MRATDTKDGFSVQAISGTRAILLAMNARQDATNNLLGFAIGTRSSPGGTIRWLRGFKFFEDLIADPKPGERRSTLEHPIQSFLWGHYSAVPDQLHHYVVRPMFRPDNGDLANLLAGTDLEVSIKSESEDSGEHTILFNRGAIVSQAYADRFGDQIIDPEALQTELEDPDAERTKWLSRGLLEGAIAFIRQARSSQHAIHCGFYELTYPPILKELAAAAVRGADIRVCYEKSHLKVSTGIEEETSTGKANLKAIAPFENKPNLNFVARTKFVSLTHNKFMVFIDNGHPAQVWTGSTNITPSGFTGQSNTGHIIRDETVAKAYAEYFDVLARDEDRTAFKAFNMTHTPRPGDQLPQNSVTPFFSPRSGTKMLDWYGRRIQEASQTILLTSAFGVTRKLADYLAPDQDFLRFILMERESRGEGVQDMLEADNDMRITLGQALGEARRGVKIDGWSLDKWFRSEEHFRTRGHIFYVHTKYMAIDPLTDDPLVFTGSANFSPNSLSGNDENMLLIRGNKSVADIYTTEFFRLFNHFYFREIANRLAISGNQNPDRAVFLDSDDSWVAGHYRAQNYRAKRRELFGVPA